MSDMGRVLKLSCRYRFTMAGVILSSLAVALLWGGNIGALYPVFEVVVEGKAIPQWLDDEIHASEAKIAELTAASNLLDPATQSKQLALNAARITAEQHAIEFKQSIQPYVKRYAPDDAFQTTLYVIVALLIATAVKNFFIVVNLLLVARLEQLTIFDLRKQFFDHTLRMDMKAFSTEKPSSLVSKFNNDINNLQVGLRSLFGSAIREPLKMFACLIGAALISWRLLLISLLLVPLVGFLIRVLAGSIKRANRRALEEFSQLVGVISETFSGIQTIQAYTLEKARQSAFLATSREMVAKAMKIAFYNSLTKPTTEVLGIGVVAMSLLFGAYLVLNQETHVWGIRISDRPLTTPILLVFYGLLIGASDPARRLSELFNQIQGGVAAANRLYPLLDRRPNVTDPVNPKSPPKQHQQIIFENVRFEYIENTPILHDVNLAIQFGETIAIVGPNGCGKSTLANLVPRFYDPIAGQVRLDDVNLRDLSLRDLRRKIGVVSQQTHLLDDTVMNNIRFGSLRASDEQVIDAAKKAHAHRFIQTRLDDGYQTMVGPGGNRLSGGQRQRICLARAILRDPEILILDEATSQVDLESEQIIHNVLAEFTRGRTSIMITHRLSTLSLADRVVVMNAGRIVDIGTHDELIARCDLYQRLHEIQFRQSA